MAEQQPMTQQRLAAYVSLRLENENRLERLARLKNEAEIPAARQGNESQHTPGTGDRMERAIIRAMEYEDKVRPLIDKNRLEMETIEAAINGLPDPMEREVLRLRYLDGENYRLTPWREIASLIYGADGEAQIRAVFRLHGSALKNIQGEINVCQ